MQRRPGRLSAQEKGLNARAGGENEAIAPPNSSEVDESSLAAENANPWVLVRSKAKCAADTARKATPAAKRNGAARMSKQAAGKLARPQGHGRRS
jgi:hypothetical protein